jgi:hypothetical protein
MANKQVITLENNDDYIHFTGDHSTEIIFFIIGDDSVFGTGELVVITGTYQDDIFTELTTQKDLEGNIQTIKFSDNYSFSYQEKQNGMIWYGIKLINAGGTSIKVYISNGKTIKSNKPVL